MESPDLQGHEQPASFQLVGNENFENGACGIKRTSLRVKPEVGIDVSVRNHGETIWAKIAQVDDLGNGEYFIILKKES